MNSKTGAFIASYHLTGDDYAGAARPTG